MSGPACHIAMQGLMGITRMFLAQFIFLSFFSARVGKDKDAHGEKGEKDKKGEGWKGGRVEENLIVK